MSYRDGAMTAAEYGNGRKWWAMAAVAIGVFLSTIDGSIVNVALPTLARSLHASFASIQWVVLAYLLTLSTLMLVAGRLADMYGKKRLFALGFAVFTLGSLACGLSPSSMWLVFSRVVQGLGASLLMALGGAVVTEVFPPRERGRALGLIGLMVAIGLISGPTIGGLLLGIFPWQAIFFVNLPLGVLGTALVWFTVPDSPPRRAEGFDFAGAAWAFLTLSTLLLAVTLGPRLAVPKSWVIGLGLVSILGAVGFVRAERRHPHPLLDLKLFGAPHLTVNVGTAILTFFASSGLVFLLPFYLQDLQGRTPSMAGLLLVTSPLLMGLSSPLSGWLSDRVGVRPLTTLGLGLLSLGYFLTGTLKLDTGALGYVLRVMWIGLGMGIFQAPNNSAIMGAVPRERLGVASGIVSLTRTFGQTTGVALVGAFWGAMTTRLSADLASEPMRASNLEKLAAFGWTARALGVVVGIGLLVAARDWWLRRNALATVTNSGP